MCVQWIDAIHVTPGDSQSIMVKGYPWSSVPQVQTESLDSNPSQVKQ